MIARTWANWGIPLGWDTAQTAHWAIPELLDEVPILELGPRQDPRPHLDGLRREGGVHPELPDLDADGRVLELLCDAPRGVGARKALARKRRAPQKKLKGAIISKANWSKRSFCCLDFVGSWLWGNINRIHQPVSCAIA